ncbi:hypothetical protein EPYR_02395 [Erwinia pyrifoliae DSM 12163]|nr:hypothetical protein EPYR_02395 [Erwinia pyrifoliae DSM 12163]
MPLSLQKLGGFSFRPFRMSASAAARKKALTTRIYRFFTRCLPAFKVDAK